MKARKRGLGNGKWLSLQCRIAALLMTAWVDAVEKVSKLPGANLPAVNNLTDDRRFGLASITLPRSPGSSSSGNEVPQIFTRKSRVQPKEILMTSAKRLFQQHRSTTAVISTGSSSLLHYNQQT
jgi:hypothetical protein